MMGEKVKTVMRSLLILMCITAWQPGHSQNRSLTLQVADSANMPVAHATVKTNQTASLVDSTGRISLVLPAGKYQVEVSAVGHNPAGFTIQLTHDTTLYIVLRKRESLLQNVLVTASRNVHRNQMSIQSIDIAQIQKLPVILGEIDPLKTITLLPGVKNGGEASAGLYVRGGGPDQNLFLLDGIPVYNPNHLLGFFSVFNGEAIKNVEVIKGGIPAEYGGRLSSVISVNTRDGHKDSLKAGGGIGLISSRLSVEGPIIKGKSSFIVSARRTYIDQVARLVAPDTIGNNGYYFYDVNAKINYQINQNNGLYFTFYTGKDDFTFANKEDEGPEREFNALWGNTIFGLTWKQQMGKKLKQELSAIRNDFSLDSRIAYNTSGFVFSSGLTDHTFKNDWQFSLNNWIKFKWGWQYTKHTFRPGAGGTSAGVQEFKSRINDQYAHEAAAYAGMDINITPRLNMIAGVRYSYFNQVGPTERVIYNPDGSPSGETEIFKKGESIARYHYPEPRVSFLYKLPGESSVKLSYTRTIQYLHLATTSAATFPGDLWVPASRLIQPGMARQLAAGYVRSFGNGMFEASAEAYYKTMSNQLEFKPGAQLLLNQNIEGEMIFGSGKAYGLELFLQKKKGRFTGWIGYTISRAERTFPTMNEGKPFPYRYDRTHDLSVVTNYKLSRKWDAAAVFVYSTGNALTMPSGRFMFNIGYDTNEQKLLFTNINQYEKINDYRMPAYHRMDIAFTFTPKPESTRRFKSSWVFSLYNIYNRANPYFIYLDVDEDTRSIQGKKVFLFPVVPGITWNFKL
jgi:Outer membrane receptor proteins, mostly Fe transport